MVPAGSPERLHVCPGCGSPEPASSTGGAVTCSRCQTASTLPDRSTWLGGAGRPPAVSADDPARLAHLRAQDGRPRQVPPTLQAVLGGQQIQTGREQEALAIWQSLRARAQAGDVAASEDLSVLTLLLVQLPSMMQQPALSQALSESALDAAVLPRHRQEQLGRLCRLAASQGNRSRAQSLLAGMIADAPELETDSEYRLSAAVVASLDRNAPRVLAVLGPRKDAVPIADSLDALASVLRANAYELQGDLGTASQILRELPDPQLLPMVQSRFQALQLCLQSAHAYGTATTQEAAQRAATSAGAIGALFGGALVFSGLVAAGLGVVLALATDDGLAGGLAPIVIGAVLAGIGAVAVVRARARGRHASWLRTHGLSLGARIVEATATGTLINDVPMYAFTLQVSGPQGPYTASIKKLAREHEIAMLLGHEVRVRANPQNLQEVILEE